MANTSDGGEVKTTLVVLDEALYLTIMYPWCPWLSNVPVELVKPFTGSQSWHSTVSVTREEKHFDVVLMCEDAVNPK